MKIFTSTVHRLFFALTLFMLSSCGGSSNGTSSISGASGVAFFPDATSFSTAEQLNPFDSLFGSVNTNFYALNGSPLENTSQLIGVSTFIGQAAFRESNTGTLFSGTYRITLNHTTGSGFGTLDSLSVAHSDTESRFIDGGLSIVVDNLNAANYSGQVSGALSETALSPRVGLTYNINGFIDGSLVNAMVDNISGTRTLGVLTGTIIRSTGDSSPADGLFYAHF